jgi:hypothetical protein
VKLSLGDSFEPFFPLGLRCVRRDRTDRTPHLRAIDAELLTFFPLIPIWIGCPKVKTIRKTTQISAKIDSGILTDGINL